MATCPKCSHRPLTTLKLPNHTPNTLRPKSCPRCGPLPHKVAPHVT